MRELAVGSVRLRAGGELHCMAEWVFVRLASVLVNVESKAEGDYRWLGVSGC